MLMSALVEDYALAAIRHARFERLEEGIVAASVPQLPGLLAFGANAQDCLLDLYRRVERWVQASLDERRPIPIIDEIDLNTAEVHERGVHRQSVSDPSEAEFFASDEEFEAALDRWEGDPA